MPKSSLFCTQPRVFADFGTICRFIDVVHDLDVLSSMQKTIIEIFDDNKKIFDDDNKKTEFKINNYPLTH